MVPDKLFINLKIIGKIQKNGRLKKSSDGVIALDKDWYLQGIWRALASDSRKQTMFEIVNIVNDIPNVIEGFKNSKYLTRNYSLSDEFSKLMQEFKMLIEAMTEAEVGLQNLKFTYIRDENVTAQMDIVIFRIENLVREAKQIYDAHSSSSCSNSMSTLTTII
jgi:hypothetical protein